MVTIGTFSWPYNALTRTVHPVFMRQNTAGCAVRLSQPLELATAVCIDQLHDGDALHAGVSGPDDADVQKKAHPHARAA